MILMKKTYILILILIQILILCCPCLGAQIIGQEVAYLQTDRTSYIAGESVFYKFYVLNADTKKPSDISDVGYVLVRAANSAPSLKLRIKINSGAATGSFDLPDTLSTGVYQIVAFTSAMKNFGEQNFSYKEIVVANRFDKEQNLKIPNLIPADTNATKQTNVLLPEIKTNKEVYALREKVTVSLGKTNFKGNVAVTVFEEPKITLPEKSIAEILNKPLVGLIDNRHLTNSYLPEKGGKILRGRVIDVTTKKTIQSAMVLLSCVDSVPNLQYASTDPNGLFQLLLSDYYNGKELFLSIKNVPDNQQWKIEIEDEFALSEKWSPSLTLDNNSYKEFVAKSQDIVYVNKSYQLNNDAIENPISGQQLICPQLYHCPVKTVLPSDFVPLNDFREIAVEILPSVRIYKDNGKYRVQVFNDFQQQFFYTDPVIFLDGVFVDDIKKIIGLGSEEIKKIDIINAERAFGDLVFQGVISITSKSNEIENTKPASHSLRLKNDKVNKGRDFVAVNPDLNPNQNIPYFKQLLYWNPNLELNGIDSTNFEFYTSDNAAGFIIKVEGVLENGMPIYSMSRIQVENQIKATDK